MAEAWPFRERVDDLLAEILAARSEGRPQDVDALLAANPDLALPLQERLAALPFVDLALDRDSRRGPLRERVLPERVMPERVMPERVGEYRIVREIGRGGMGVVFEAEQTSLGRPVALKVLSLAITSTPESVRRFQREARAAARLHHTNIVPVYGMGQHAGHWYYAMELVQGQPLSRVLDDLRGLGTEPASRAPTALSRPSRSRVPASSSPSPTPGTASTNTPSTNTPSTNTPSTNTPSTNVEDRAYFARIARMFAGVADALQVAHVDGVVHRDVKPANLILTPDGVLKLVDFGLAHLEEEGPTLTRDGGALGTPSYMSPEQARGQSREADFRSDIYSLGATLYEVLTLRAPFRGRTSAEILQKVISHDPVMPRRVNRRVPRDLQTIVLKAMEKDPARRYATAAGLARDLYRYAEGGVIQARRIGVLGRTWRRIRRHPVRSALAAAAVVLVAVAAWLATSAREESHRRLALEYENLLARGQKAIGRSLGRVIESEFREIVPRDAGRAGDAGTLTQAEANEDATAVDLLTRALTLDATSPDPWLLRALAPGRPLEDRLADVAEAERRGLAPDTVRLADAYLRNRAGKLAQADLDALVASPPAAPDARAAFLLADLQYAAGRQEEALVLLADVIRDARRDDAIHHLALRLRALIHRQREDHALALADLFAIRALGEDSPNVALAIVGVWGRKGDREAADGLLRQVLYEARAANDLGRWHRVLRAARREVGDGAYADVVKSAYEAFPGDPLHMTLRAERLFREGRADDGRRLMQAALGQAPDDHDVLGMQGVLLSSLGDHDAAVSVLEKALALCGDLHQILEKLGIVYLDAKRPGQAVGPLERAHALDRTCPHCLLRLASAYGESGRAEEAERTYARLLGMRPRSAIVYAERGAQRWNLKRDTVAALADMDRALELAPDFGFARFNKGIILNQTGRPAEALEEFRKVQALQPDRVDGWTLTVSALLHLRRDREALAEADAAIAKFPLDPQPRLTRCDVHLAMGRPDAAFEDASEVLAGHPDHPSALYQMARCEQARDRLPEALLLVQRAIAVQERPEYLTAEAGIRESLGKLDEAISCLERAAQLWPLHPQARYNLGRMLRKKGNLAAAMARLDEAIAMPGPPSLWGDAMTMKARCLTDLKRFQEARALYDACIERAPDDPATYVRRGEFLNNDMKLPQDAERDFRKAIEVDADFAAAWSDLAPILLRQGRTEEAAKVLATAIRLQPRDRGSTLRLADLHRNSGRPAEAIPLYRAGFELDRKQVGPLYWMSICHQDLDQWEPSIAVLNELLEIKPDDPEALHDKAIALGQLKKFDEALAAYDLASHYGPKWALPWYSRAWVHQQLGQTEQQIAAYRKAIELSPKFSWALNDLAWEMEKQENLTEALDLYSRAIAADPAYLLPYRSRARCWLRLDQPEKALADTEVAVRLDPKGGYTLYGHADALWHVGRHDDALATLETAIRHDPEAKRDSLWRMLLIVSETGAHHRWLDLATRLEAEDPGDPLYVGWRVAALRAMRRDEEAKAAAREALARPLRDGTEGSRAYLLAVAGEREAALKMLEAMGPDDDAGARRQAAIVCAVLGDANGVKHWLRRYLEEKGPKFPPKARIDPDIERLASDPEVKALIVRMLERPAAAATAAPAADPLAPRR